MFKSLIHFELLFVYKETIVFFFDVSIQFFQHHLLMKLSFPYLCVCGNFIQINWSYIWGFICGLSILSIGPYDSFNESTIFITITL